MLATSLTLSLVQLWTGVCLSIAILVAWTLIEHVRLVFRSDLRQIPGPLTARLTAFWRVLFGGNAPDVYKQLHAKYGPIVQTAPGVVSVSDPNAIQSVYGIGSKLVKSSFYSVFDVSYRDHWMPSMFSVREPARHQALRRPVAQKFSMSSIKSMEPFVDECNDIFLQAMRDLEGHLVDLGTWLQWYAFDAISAMTFGGRFGFMEQRKDVENLIGDISQGLVACATVGQVPGLHPWLMGSRWLPALLGIQPFLKVPDPLRTVVQFTDDCITQYDLNPPSDNRPDFMGWLRAASLKGEPLSQDDFVNHLSNNLLAGSDTTAISLRAIIYYLVKNPICYEKAQREIDQASKAGTLSTQITYAESLTLPYLQTVIKEAMRCHPGVSYPLERIVPEEGIEVAGVHLQKGTVIGISAPVMHSDTSIFGQDANDFNPERWLQADQDKVKQMDRCLMTFGYGTRTCIGKNISLMEMGKLVPRLLREFDLEWASEKPEWQVFNYWFARQEGLICRLRQRHK